MKIPPVFCVVAFSLVALLPTPSQAADKPVEVVNFSKLIPLLPEPPKDWTAEKAEGQTMDTAGFKLTTASRHYRTGGGVYADIQIVDSAESASYKAMTTAMWSFNQETTEAYTKGITIDGMRGFENYKNKDKQGTLWLFVGDRFFVMIELKKQEPKDLREWLKRIDLKKLAEVK